MTTFEEKLGERFIEFKQGKLKKEDLNIYANSFYTTYLDDILNDSKINKQNKIELLKEFLKDDAVIKDIKEKPKVFFAIYQTFLDNKNNIDFFVDSFKDIEVKNICLKVTPEELAPFIKKNLVKHAEDLKEILNNTDIEVVNKAIDIAFNKEEIKIQIKKDIDEIGLGKPKTIFERIIQAFKVNILGQENKSTKLAKKIEAEFSVEKNQDLIKLLSEYKKDKNIDDVVDKVNALFKDNIEKNILSSRKLIQNEERKTIPKIEVSESNQNIIQKSIRSNINNLAIEKQNDLDLDLATEKALTRLQSNIEKLEQQSNSPEAIRKKFAQEFKKSDEDRKMELIDLFIGTYDIAKENHIKAKDIAKEINKVFGQDFNEKDLIKKIRSMREIIRLKEPVKKSSKIVPKLISDPIYKILHRKKDTGRTL